jgi:uncharacterized alkaline shock family protein YloU
VVLWRVEVEVADPEGPERSGRIAHGLPTPASGPCPTQPGQEDLVRVPIQPTPGRSLVTRRAVVDLIRSATLGSYGVTGFAGRPLDRLVERLGLAQPGIVVNLGDTLDIELDLTVAYGVPIAEVGRQVDSAVRYAVRRALAIEVRRLTIHIDGLRFGPGGAPPTVVHPAHAAIGLRDLADSGTDVA